MQKAGLREQRTAAAGFAAMDRMGSGRMIEAGDQDEGVDRDAQDAVEGRKPGGEQPADSGQGRPPAGPHATPEKTNDEATPGSGALPEEGEADSVEPGSS